MGASKSSWRYDRLPWNLLYKTRLRCSWSIPCRRCSNYIFILDLTPVFDGLAKTTARRDENHLSLVIWCVLDKRFDSISPRRPVISPRRRNMSPPWLIVSARRDSYLVVATYCLAAVTFNLVAVTQDNIDFKSINYEAWNEMTYTFKNFSG